MNAKVEFDAAVFEYELEVNRSDRTLRRYLGCLRSDKGNCNDEEEEEECEGNCDNENRTRFPRSQDPNDILGPIGFGDLRWTSTSDSLNYTVRFENDPEFATAPAQVITIRQDLDSDLDLRTFRLGNFGFGEFDFDVADNQAFFDQRIDLTEEFGIFVDVTAGIDVVSGEAFWELRSIDPATGETPINPLVGFLPPNLLPPEGDGFVNYTIRPKRNLPSGTRIDAEATIVFDINDPIDTPPIFNTLDSGAPTSRVVPLPNTIASDRFEVSWSGLDEEDGSGIANYSVFVATNDGPYELWLEQTELTTAEFIGELGQSYQFYSIAYDNVGHAEAAPSSSDASISTQTADGPRVLVSPTNLVVTEGASEDAVFTIALNTIPSSPVTVGITIPTGQVTASETTIVFAADASALVPRTVYVSATEDTLSEGDHVGIVQYSVVSADALYDQIRVNDVVVQIRDNDAAALEIAITAGSVSEPDGDAATTVTVTRNTDSTNSLTVNLQSDDTSEVSVPSTVDIPAGQSSVTVNLNAIDDSTLDGTQTVTISASAPSLLSASESIDVTDNETATVSIQAIRDANESNTIDGQFLVSLDRTPEVDLDIFYSVAGTATGGSDYSALSGTATIAAGTNSVAIDVSVIDDGIAEVVETLAVQLTSTSMPDNVTIDSAATTDEISVFSDDLNVIKISKSTVTVSEDGTTAAFQVTLGAKPTAAVIVNIASTNTAEVAVSAATLTFSPANWDIPQSVTVTGVDDGVTDGTQNVDVTLSIDVAASSSEFRFSPSETVDVLNADNEAPPAIARLEDITFFNQDANREDGLSLDQTGQRSIVRHVQVVLEGTISITEASLTDGTFAVTNLSLGEDVALIFDSVVQSAGRTVVVLSFAEGTSVVGGGLIDGNYQLKIDGGPHRFDADGSGAAGGVAETLFHRLFGDTDGDRDVDNSDYGKFYQAYFGDEVYQATLDRDDDDDLFDEIDTFFSNYGKQLTS